ncbi:MAG TPA: PA14 domain-containing protein [Candidatus Aquilonibacter sp.]|nr:PA14 domain-containing protein [Candidatus Aquilonibacter sp.]
MRKLKLSFHVWLAISAANIVAGNAAGESVLTYHNNNARTGANTNETQLTLANVNTNSFGLLMKYPVDGYVYTQPLFVPGVKIPGKGTRDVVYVATENDSVYAFDANSNTGPERGRLWHVSLGEGVDVVTNHEFGGRSHHGVLQDMLPRVGITGTPVIDPVSQTLYVVALTRVATATATNFYQHLHALDLATGAEKPGSPVLVGATCRGTGMDSSNGVVTFVTRQQNERCALTLAGGILYIAYGSYADTDPYHGWILGYNPATLQLLTNYIFNITPNATKAVFGPHAGEGGLWMAGGGLCVDDQTNLYFEVANGSFDANTGGVDYGDSFVKLSASNGLAVADYFTPFNQAELQAGDVDLGSGAPVLLPDDVGSAAHPHLIVGGGKESKIYLVDRDHMGHYNATNNSQIVQSFEINDGKLFSTPAYFNYTIYDQGIGGVLEAFAINNGHIDPTPTSTTMTSFSGFGTTPSISANGLSNAIVWTIQSDGAVWGRPAILHAYNATNLAVELYNSGQLPDRDNPGNAVKMTVPTIANGRVFVGAQYALSIFGNGIFLPDPVVSPKGGNFANQVTVTLTDAMPNVSIYYTLDDSTPTSDSTLYTGPLAVTNTLKLKAVAIKTGAVNSGVTAAAFLNTAAAGHGTGLLSQYWKGADFDTPPTLTRTDAVVNFDWETGGPVGPGSFSARWEGSVQALDSDTYNFMTVTRGGVRLWINGRLIIDDWTAPSFWTTNSVEVPLQSQQFYNLQMDYLSSESGGGEKLFWSSPSISREIIPQSQLYPYINPPPTITLVRPPTDDTYVGSASVTLGADAEAPENDIVKVDFYANANRLGTLSNSVYAPIYAITTTGLNPGSYVLTAVATDGSGLVSTSAPVKITVTTGSGRPYGLTNREVALAYLNMPATYNSGALPRLLSETGVYRDTLHRIPTSGLIPYAPNVPKWSDGAVASDYLAVPNTGGVITPDEQLRLHPTDAWTFPDGTVFVKNLDLTVDETNPKAPRRRLETQILVRDANGGVYGVIYKWRADNSDADLLLTSSNEDVLVTNADGVSIRKWYYCSPSDCLTCHTPGAGYVLGVNTRQLNGNFTYPSGITDNQIRTLNRLGLFSPAINEDNVAGYARLYALTNSGASLEERARSYLNANCAQCHRPGGVGSYDARYDTPLKEQHIVNYPAIFPLVGRGNAFIVKPRDVEDSILWLRISSLEPTVKMPPLAHNLVDTNAVKLIGDWINSLPAPASNP